MSEHGGNVNIDGLRLCIKSRLRLEELNGMNPEEVIHQEHFLLLIPVVNLFQVSSLNRHLRAQVSALSKVATKSGITHPARAPSPRNAPSRHKNL